MRLLMILLALLVCGCQMQKVDRLSESQKEALAERAKEIVNDPKNRHLLVRLSLSQQDLVKETMPVVTDIVFPVNKKTIQPNVNESISVQTQSQTEGIATVKWVGLLGVHCYVKFMGDLSKPAFCNYRFGLLPPQYIDINSEFEEDWSKKYVK